MIQQDQRWSPRSRPVHHTPIRPYRGGTRVLRPTVVVHGSKTREERRGSPPNPDLLSPPRASFSTTSYLRHPADEVRRHEYALSLPRNRRLPRSLILGVQRALGVPAQAMGLAEAVPSIGSCAAGALFGAAWLVWIDGVAYASTEYGHAVDGAYWVPGILQTVGLLMVNVVNWSLLTEDAGFGDDGGVASKVKAWVFVSFVFSFSGLIGSVWILVQEAQNPSWEGGAVQTAVRCLLQNLFLFGSSLVFRAVRTGSSDN